MTKLIESEQTLIEKAKAGDTRAFDVLVKRHESKIYNLLLGITGSRTAADDLFQESFLTAWRKIRSFRGDSSLSTWLYRIAVNTALMKKRKKGRVNTVSIDAPIVLDGKDVKREFQDDWSKSPLASMENTELKERVSKAIGALPEKYKAVLIMRDMEGLSNEEVKKVLNISLPSVKSRLHRARFAVRNELSKYFRGL
jgi:RNA polymerase sigma-70 factor (ECF subfamily)